MGNAKFIGRVGALAVALGVGFAATIAPGAALAESDETPSTNASTDRTALVMGGTTVPTPDDFLVEIIKNHYIEPTHRGEDIDYVVVTTPEEAWPITGLTRLIGLALGPPSVWGPGGAGWPNEPWWKLSGLFDLTLNQSVQAGVANLETAMAKHGNDPLVIYGISQGSVVATVEKRKLAKQYPEGTTAPDIDFVMHATLNLPNGGLFSRFPGLYIPILDWTFNGPAPTGTQFDTVVINQQYDGAADFPLYPINVIADLNALLGVFACYVHCYAWDVSLPADPTKSPAYQGTHGDTSYYFFENPDLPLFGPLRTLGVPESLIDVVEPFFRVIVELGYDRSIPPWEPTPARLIPRLNPVKVVADLVGAIGEGINNARAIFSPPPPSVPASTPQPGVPDVPAEEHAVDLEQRTGAEQTPLMRTATDADLAPSSQQTADVDQAPLVQNVTEPDQATSKQTAIESDDQVTEAKSPKSEEKPPDSSSARRTAERGPIGTFRQRSRDLLHRGNGDQPIVRAAAVGDATRPAEASKQDSFSAGSPTGGDSSGGDGTSGNDAGDS